jgi:myo-inositol-1(or 4)-monophosphatase
MRNKKLEKGHESRSTLSAELQIAVKAVKKAADAIQKIYIAGTEQIKSGGVNDLVTAWDLAAQQSITDNLMKKFPTDKILGEESEYHGENPARQDRLWVIDPVDGTANAHDGRRYSFISLGFVRNGESLVGVVYDLYHDDLFYAEKEKGSFRNGKPIHISNDPSRSPHNARINTDMGYIASVSDLHGDMLKAHGSPTRRMMGSAVGEMVEIAAGIADLFFYTTLKPWDNAAVFRILKEAGVEVRGTDGRAIDFTAMDVVAGRKDLVEDFVKRVGVPFKEKIKMVQNNFLKKNPEIVDIVSGL